MGGTGGFPSKPLKTDERKRAQKNQKRRQQILNTVTRLLDTVLTKPEVWGDPDMKPIREKCYQITNNRIKYPPPLQMCVEKINTVSPTPSDENILTVGFSKKIYERELIKVCGGFLPPLVQVLNVSSRYKNHYCCQTKKEQMVNQVTLTVVDGDGIVLNCKIASQMIGFVGLLTEGVVIKILQFRTINFSYHATDRVIQKILLITHFEVKCNPGKMLVKRVEKYWLDKEKEVEGSARVSVVAGCSSASPNDGVDTECAGDGVGVVADLKCNGEYCTRYGVKFNRCIRSIFPVKEHRLDELVAANHWMNGKTAEYMTMKETRFVLYCWYTINIFHMCGLGNR